MNLPPDYSVGQIAEMLGAGTAFSGMPRAEALLIVQLMSMRQYEPGDILSRPGSENKSRLMLVVSGEAKISGALVNGVENLVYRWAKPGHIIGEVGFIDGLPHSATCTAITAMNVAILERDSLTELLAHRPLAAAQLMAGLLKLMAQRIRHCNMTIQTLVVVHDQLQKEIETQRVAK